MGNSGESWRTRRQERLAIRFGLLVVMFMLLSSVFSIVGNVPPVALAQPDCAEDEVLNPDTGACDPAAELPPPDCAEDEMLNPDTGQCDPVDAAAPPDCPDGEALNADTGACEPAVDAAPPDCAEDEMLNANTGACEPTDGGMVEISKFECPSGFTGEGSNSNDFAAMCTGSISGVAFEAYDSAGIVGGGATDPGGNLTILELPLGQVSIVESIPDGYGAPFVFCASGDDPNSLSGFDDYVVTDGYYATIDLGSAPYFACSWYNMPEDDSGIVIVKFDCPAGHDPAVVPYETLLVDCAQDQDGVEFSLGNGAAAYASGLTGEDGPGRLIFEEYQPGAVTITETIPEGYGAPAVFCSSQIFVEEPDGNIQYNDAVTDIMDVAADGSINTEVAENRLYVCHWFNFPAADYDIVIYKYVCPTGYAPAAFEYGPLLADCTGETRDGVVFHVGDRTQATGEVIPGGVAFVGYESGDLVIREELPSGYIAYAFCGQSSGGVAFDQMTPVPTLLTLAEDGSITVNLPENSRLICYWFNVLTEISIEDASLEAAEEVDEEQEPGYIGGLTLQHFACDPGLDLRANQGRWTLLQLCTGAGKPAFVYDIYVDQTLIESVGLQTAPNTSGEVSLPAVQQEPIPAGLVTIVVDQPAGYDGAKVNCLLSRIDDSSEAFAPYLIDDPSIMLYLGPGESLACEWFNAPVEPGIAISAWICPPGYNATDAYDTFPYALLLQNCAQPHAGVEFSLGLGLSTDDMGAYAFGSTGEDGRLRFDDYNPGDLVIAETIPEGYGAPLAYCSFDYDPSSGLVNSTGFDGYLRTDGGIPENSLLTCDFFSFPADDTYVLPSSVPPSALDGAGEEDLPGASDTYIPRDNLWVLTGTPEPIDVGDIQITQDDFPGAGDIYYIPRDDLPGASDIYNPEDSPILSLTRGTIEIFTFECPFGFSGESSSTLDDYRSMCTTPLRASFRFKEVSILGWNRTVATDESGYVQLSGIGGTPHLVSGGHSWNTREQRLFCGHGDDATSARQSYYDWSFFNDPANPIKFAYLDLTAVDYYSCYWFSIPTSISGPVATPGASDSDIYNPEDSPILSLFRGTIEIFAFTCPSGFSGGSSSTLDNYRSMCTAPRPGVEFHVTTDVGPDPTLHGGLTDAGGYLQFSGLGAEQAANGAEQFGVSQRRNYGEVVRDVRVFCGHGDDATSARGHYYDWSYYPSAGAYYIYTDFTAIDYSSCYWFTTPDG